MQVRFLFLFVFVLERGVWWWWCSYFVLHLLFIRACARRRSAIPMGDDQYPTRGGDELCDAGVRRSASAVPCVGRRTVRAAWELLKPPCLRAERIVP